MSDKNNFIPEDDYEYEKKLAEKERLSAEQREKQRIEEYEEAREAEKQERAAHEQQLQRDKIELMKLKSGVIDESDTLAEEHDVLRKPKGFERITNFIYHYKLMIIFVVFIAFAVGYMIYDAVSRDDPDLTVIMAANNGLANRTEELEQFFEKYTGDVNGDGEVHVQIISCPLNSNSVDTMQTSYQAKFLAQLQTGENVIVITDSNTEDDFKACLKTDLKEDFPDNEYISEQGFSLNFTFVAEELDYESMPYDVVMSIRLPVKTLSDSEDTMQENYDRDFVVYKRIVDDCTQKAKETNDPGLTTEPIKMDTSETDVSE